MGAAYENGRYSAVVTNPPFGKKLMVSAADARLSSLDLAKKGTPHYEDLEIALMFLQRAHQLLRVGGRLGIILPETYFFSDGYKFVMDWLRLKFTPKVVLNVPMEAFQGFCREKSRSFSRRRSLFSGSSVAKMNPDLAMSDEVLKVFEV